ncbi:MAG: response regulator [Rickettsiaceae bacterium]
MPKILIVEDNELNLKLFYDLLTIKKFSILISRNGLDVIEIVKQEKPNVILMDIQLNSQVSGTDLIKELKGSSDTASIPIIVITAFAMKQEEEMLLKSGCDLYLSKPVSIYSFFNAIDKCL